jgi:hypothetical protein
VRRGRALSDKPGLGVRKSRSEPQKGDNTRETNEQVVQARRGGRHTDERVCVAQKIDDGVTNRRGKTDAHTQRERERERDDTEMRQTEGKKKKNLSALTMDVMMPAWFGRDNMRVGAGFSRRCRPRTLVRPLTR